MKNRVHNEAVQGYIVARSEERKGSQLLVRSRCKLSVELGSRDLK